MLSRLLFISLFIGCIITSFATNNKGLFKYPQSTTDYQSDFEWLSPTKLKYHFYVYRSHYQIIQQFPDTCFIYLRYNGNLWSDAVFMLKDSNISHPNKLCNPAIIECHTDNCTGPYEGNITYNKSIFRYTGIIDFSQADVKDTLNKWGACMVDIGFRGDFVSSILNPNIAFQSSAQFDYFCYFSINRCFKWQGGDKSPVPRLFHVPNNYNNSFDKGLQQMDFGSNAINYDSINYQLELPKKYYGGTYSFKSPYSKNYYADGYCPSGGPPCNARPTLNPPRGFYLSPLTGITTKYITGSISLNTPMYYIEIQLFKKDSNNTMQQVALLSRAQTHFTFSDNNGNGKNVITDIKLNKRIEIETLPLYRYPCEAVADTVTFTMRDTLAINQTAQDTIDYKFINTLPSSTVNLNTKASNLIEAKIQWTPPANSQLKNPYIFNVYATELKCNKDKREVFRSCEYNVIPTPRLSVSLDSSLCGVLKFKANSANITDYNYQWQISNGIKTYTSAKYSDSIVLTANGKWLIKLKVANIQYGCNASFTDSFITNNALHTITIAPKNSSICKQDSVIITSNVANAKGAITYQWYLNKLPNIQKPNITIKDSDRVKLVVTDSRNCKAIDSNRINLYPAIKYTPLPDTAICKNMAINIMANKQAATDTLTWLHNGSKNSSQILSQKGTYILQYKSMNSCMVYDTFKINAIDTFYSNIQFKDTICKGANAKVKVIKNNTFQYNLQAWYMLNNPNIIATGDSISQATQAPISFVLKTEVEAYKIKCANNDTFNITLYPNINFTNVFTKIDTCLNHNKTEFDFASAQTFKSKTIYWGDGNTEIFTTQLSHKYAAIGNYKIQGILETTQGCNDTFTQSVNILPSPQANFSLNDTALCIGKSFIASISSLPTNVIQSINWGNGNVNNGVSNSNYPQTYAIAGNYTIKLIASLSNACADTMAKTIMAYPQPQTQIQATRLCLGDSSYYQYTVANNIPILGQAWLINGNNISNQKAFKQFNNTLGTFSIVLNTLSDNGCLNTETKTIKIVEKPTAVFTHTRIVRNINGIELYFVNQSTNSNAWRWQFENKDTSIIQNPKYTYIDTGFKTVILIANNQNTCFDTLKQIIPVLDFIEFYFPTAFSPNGNVINDGFGLNPNQHILATTYHIEIYTRWGGKVFETNNKTETWLPAYGTIGVYIYKAQVRDIYNVLHDYKGVVEVLR